MNTFLEWAAVAFNIAYVILAARKNNWCWPLGIVGSALSIMLFVNTKLYAESVLFSYYIVMGFYGWWQWSGHRSDSNDLEIKQWKITKHIKVLLLGYFGTTVLFGVLQHFTDAVMPLLDSFTTVFSFIATWMVAKRLLENWIYWIAIDALTIYLYASRGLNLYAALSAVYTLMAIYGYVAWSREASQKTFSR